MELPSFEQTLTHKDYKSSRTQVKSYFRQVVPTFKSTYTQSRHTAVKS